MALSSGLYLPFLLSENVAYAILPMSRSSRRGKNREKAIGLPERISIARRRNRQAVFWCIKIPNSFADISDPQNAPYWVFFPEYCARFTQVMFCLPFEAKHRSTNEAGSRVKALQPILPQAWSVWIEHYNDRILDINLPS